MLVEVDHVLQGGLGKPDGARNPPGVYKKFKDGRVAIAGLGGLGSNIAVMLARSGVGHLLLVDFDLVEPSNLNRQNYTVHHLGMPKTLAMQMQLTEINPFIQVEIRTVRVDAANVLELFAGYEIICEAFDTADAKSMLVNSALERLPESRRCRFRHGPYRQCKPDSNDAAISTAVCLRRF